MNKAEIVEALIDLSESEQDSLIYQARNYKPGFVVGETINSRHIKHLERLKSQIESLSSQIERLTDELRDRER